MKHISLDCFVQFPFIVVLPHPHSSVLFIPTLYHLIWKTIQWPKQDSPGALTVLLMAGIVASVVVVPGILGRAARTGGGLSSDLARFDDDTFECVNRTLCVGETCCAAGGGRAMSGSLTSQDFDTFLRSFCADSLSPRISAILPGHVTRKHGSLHNSPQNFRKQKHRHL